ncbi:MAG: helical backbone metal receptor [bacterium]|nr:helical backbone metal receptor [bacterium]
MRFFCICLLFFAVPVSRGDAADSLRIICLAPDANEIIFDIGADRYLVGITDECDYPPASREIPKVGSFSFPCVESIVVKDPDVIITSGLEQSRLNGDLKKLGFKTLEVFPSGLEGMFDAYRKIGEICGMEDKAEKCVRRIRESAREIKLKSSKFNYTPKIYLEIWDTPLMTVSGESFLNEIIEIAGGVNITGQYPRAYCRINPEVVIKQDPDIIIILHGNSNAVFSRAGWQNISAVKNGYVFDDIDQDTLVRVGPRLADALEQVYLKVKRYNDEKLR